MTLMILTVYLCGLVVAGLIGIDVALESAEGRWSVWVHGAMTLLWPLVVALLMLALAAAAVQSLLEDL